MPYYDYKCRDCGHEFDVRIPMDQAGTPQTCPECGATDASQVITNYGSYSIKGNNGASVSPKSTVKGTKK